LDPAALAAHPAVAGRVEEFWGDAPAQDELIAAGVAQIDLLMRGRPLQVDTAQLTLKESLLLEFLSARAGEVCARDDVIRGVWPEDQIFERGVRDDSLAQLVRRLREKIEPDPSRPRHLHTVPGRGYRFTNRPST
jgi:two-component system response regulator RegX3